MDDLISRQAAVNAIRLYECDDYKINMGLIIAMNSIEEVPSAQPLIDAICPHYIRNKHDRGDDSLCRKFQCEVSALPRKTGKWIDDNCSVCGFYVYHGDARNYCPNCGARMEGAE